MDQQEPDEGWRTQWPKLYAKFKDEENSLHVNKQVFCSELKLDYRYVVIQASYLGHLDCYNNQYIHRMLVEMVWHVIIMIPVKTKKYYCVHLTGVGKCIVCI